MTLETAPLTSGAVEETMPPCAGVARRMGAAEMPAVTSRNPPRQVGRVGKICGAFERKRKDVHHSTEISTRNCQDGKFNKVLQ